MTIGLSKPTLELQIKTALNDGASPKEVQGAVAAAIADAVADAIVSNNREIERKARINAALGVPTCP